MRPSLKLTSDIRWLLYQSAPKIEMLYGQFASKSRKKVSASVSVGPVSTSIGRETEPPTIDEKLDRVVKELSERGLVGTLDEPGEYIKGIMPMRWGLFNDLGSRPEGEAPFVYFAGFDSAVPLTVGLGGSTMNVVGHQGASSTYSRSSTREIVRWLTSGIKDGTPPEPMPWWDEDDRHGEEYHVFSAMTIALHYLRPPTQNLEFLAKTLLTGTISTHEHFTGLEKDQELRCILATPIYVAMAPPYPDDNAWGLDEEWRIYQENRREKANHRR